MTRRLCLLLALGFSAGIAAIPAAGGSYPLKPIRMHAVVLAEEARGIIVVDQQAAPHLILTALPFRYLNGDRVFITGTWDGHDRFSVWTIATGSRIRREGTAVRVTVRGTVGLVDTTNDRFTLEGHGSPLTDVAFPAGLKHELEQAMHSRSSRTFSMVRAGSRWQMRTIR